MSRTAGFYRPLTPITPSHTPSGSVASTRSRTPGQLSLHEYRKQQRQEIEPIPDAVPGKKTVKRKAPILSFHGAPTGIPTAPPTPMDFEFGFKEVDEEDDDDDVTEEELIARFISETGRKRNGKSPWREGGRFPISGRAAFSRSTPRLGPHKASSLASTSSISSLPIMAPILGRQVSQSTAPNISRLDPSPPPSPLSPLLPFPMDQSPPIHHAESIRHTKRPIFNSIKRLPRPASQFLPSLVPAPPSASPASAPAASSPYSPFSLGRYSFPDPPLGAADSRSIPIDSTESLAELSPKVLPLAQQDASLTDLLHLYGTSFELLNRHESLSSLNIVPSLSEPSSLDLSTLPVFAPQHRFRAMPTRTSNPHDNEVTQAQSQDDEYIQITDYRGRDSYYPSEFDSRSIRTTDAPATPGMKRGIRDYSDIVGAADDGSYTPTLNQIYETYGRDSSENIRPLAHRSVGRAPSSPPPPLPVGPPPPIPTFEINPSPSLERTTDYGNTQHLLRDASSTPGLEVPRRGPPASFSNLRDDIFQLPSSNYLQSTTFPLFRDGTSDAGSIVHSINDPDEWQTINTSSYNISNIESTMGESFPFTTPHIPPLTNFHQRRILTQDQIQEVPSPHSTVPESHQSLRATSPTPGVIGDNHDLYGESMISMTPLPAALASGTSPLPEPSSEYSRNASDQAKTSHIAQTPDTNLHVLKQGGKLSAYVEEGVIEPIVEGNAKHLVRKKDDGLVDPAFLSSEPNDTIETRSSHRLSRWGNFSLPLNELPQSGGLRRSLTIPGLPINHRIAQYDPSSGKTSVGVAGQNKLMDFGIEMNQLHGPDSSNRSSAAPGTLLHRLDTNLDTTHLHADTASASQSPRISPLARLKATFGLTRPPPSSQDTSLDVTIALPNNPTVPATYGRPASSARSSVQPLVPRPEPVVDRQRRRSQAWKPLKIKPREPELPHLRDNDDNNNNASVPPPSKGHTVQQKSRPLSSRIQDVAIYPCATTSTSLDVEANQPLRLDPASLAAQRDDMARQTTWSRFYLLLFCFIPIILPLYSLGVLDPIMEIHTPRRPHMLMRHRRWAWNILWAWVVAVLVTLAVWGVVRRGS
jgi:hypothetical protein